MQDHSSMSTRTVLLYTEVLLKISILPSRYEKDSVRAVDKKKYLLIISDKFC